VRRDRREASRRERIIILAAIPTGSPRKGFGATDVVSDAATRRRARARSSPAASVVHSVLECVGPEQSLLTAVGITRPGGAVGRRRVPQTRRCGVAARVLRPRHISAAPRRSARTSRVLRTYSRPDRTRSRFRPDRSIDEVPEGYSAMNERKALKVMIGF